MSEEWANDGEAKKRSVGKRTKHPHECNPPWSWWKPIVGRSWVCPRCRRRWRGVDTWKDPIGRDRPIWERGRT